MKRLIVVKFLVPFFLLPFLFFFSNRLTAQMDSGHVVALQLCCNKTTSLVFPQLIKAIDRGSQDVLVQRVSGAEHVLQLKAARENFAETNLTVITTDGKLWSFSVGYVAEPLCLVLRLDSSVNLFATIALQKRQVHGVTDYSDEMRLLLKGVYIQNDILYYQLELENNSAISYDIDRLRFYIKDKKQSRRTASQESEQLPLSVYGNKDYVPAQSKQVLVIALPKFTIPDKKYFYVDMIEKNGGRNLRLKITNRKIVHAVIL